jgi:hypothetical protein
MEPICFSKPYLSFLPDFHGICSYYLDHGVHLVCLVYDWFMSLCCLDSWEFHIYLLEGVGLLVNNEKNYYFHTVMRHHAWLLICLKFVTVFSLVYYIHMRVLDKLSYEGSGSGSLWNWLSLLFLPYFWLYVMTYARYPEYMLYMLILVWIFTYKRLIKNRPNGVWPAGSLINNYL